MVKHKYVLINMMGQNVLGEFKGKFRGGDQEFEPTLDDLTSEGWQPIREVPLANNMTLLIMGKRE